MSQKLWTIAEYKKKNAELRRRLENRRQWYENELKRKDKIIEGLQIYRTAWVAHFRWLIELIAKGSHPSNTAMVEKIAKMFAQTGFRDW